MYIYITNSDYMNIYANAFTQSLIHTPSHKHRHRQTDRHTHTHTYIYIYIYTHTHIYIYIYIYIYIRSLTEELYV